MHYYIDHIVQLTAGKGFSELQIVKYYLRQLGDPHKQLKIFHVAGTNGKGSVSNMLAQVMWDQGDHSVGLFTSPHLFRMHERIVVDRQQIGDDDLERLLAKVYEETRELGDLSFFVIMTLVSILYFVEKKVDYVVYEVGLGGKLDATNLWSQPEATFITSIGYDHMSVLGDRLSQIQRNKMGIMKTGVPCYTSVDNPLMHHGAKVKGADLHIVTDRVETSLEGEHQEVNAALVYHALIDRGRDELMVQDALMSVTHPGRLEWLRPNLLADAAHNVQGAMSLAAYVASIRDQFSSVTTIFGTSKRPEELPHLYDALLAGDVNFLVKPKLWRGVDPTIYQDQLPFATTIREDLVELIEELLGEYRSDQLIVVYGSIYLLGEFYRIGEMVERG